MSKLCASTFSCAFRRARVITRCSRAALLGGAQRVVGVAALPLVPPSGLDVVVLGGEVRGAQLLALAGAGAGAGVALATERQLHHREPPLVPRPPLVERAAGLVGAAA